MAKRHYVYRVRTLSLAALLDSLAANGASVLAMVCDGDTWTVVSAGGSLDFVAEGRDLHPRTLAPAGPVKVTR